MRRNAQVNALSDPPEDSPSRLPLPQNPVGEARVHTSRHDSRQWSMSSASKSRQPSLVVGSSTQSFTLSAGNALDQTASGITEETLLGEPDGADQAVETAGTAREQSERQRVQRARGFTTPDTQRETIVESKDRGYAPGPDFMYLSSGSSGREKPEPKRSEIDAEAEERVTQSHHRLNEVLSAPARSRRRNSETCASATPRTTTRIRSRSLCLPRPSAERDPWTHDFQLRDVLWLGEHPEAAVLIEGRYRPSERPNTLLKSSVDRIDRPLSLAPMRPPPLPPRSRGKSIQTQHDGSEPQLGVPTSSNVSQEGVSERPSMKMARSSRTVVNGDEKGPDQLLTNRPKDSRFIEHIPENEERLRGLGVGLERHKGGGGWFQKWKRRSK